ncbi:5-methyltetrahydropteroyltriglutamate--homocysteine S-methyltransferase [Singulisphaera sp. Ch08]|uniref:5-methyltetrahydropteroyltriglutamate--homocysteine methyltransferase n=2 Tax=Singulisphaera sp. Ch08 TaxID=3120278 RepID=A0AAU7CS24_9BACT
MHMAIATNLGFSRMGPHRELKKALERFWAKKSDAGVLLATACSLRESHWKLQRDLGLAQVPCNDFSLYDHVLDAALMVGVRPGRFGGVAEGLDRYFAMARGVAHEGERSGVAALEMTKWFDTNYHYLVPEFEADQEFRLDAAKPLAEFAEAKALGIPARPVLLGPVSFLLLGKIKDAGRKPLDLWPALVPVYEELLRRLRAAGADWVQIDEPCLATDVEPSTLATLEAVYKRLADAAGNMNILLATYFGDLGQALPAVMRLPVRAVHLDLVRGPGQLREAVELVAPGQMLSLGLVDGRNIWRTDLLAALDVAEDAAERLGVDRILIAPSCSLLHTPYDLEGESKLDGELKGWLAFGRQKLEEVAILARGVEHGRDSVADALEENRVALTGRRSSPRIHSAQVRRRLASVTPEMLARENPYSTRRVDQRAKTPLPLLPTTTIGSFPQTDDVRKARASFKAGKLRPDEYDAFLKERTAEAVRWQEEVGLDVLVHGEFERNDMVEYFGENLDGFAFTENGWVQSYGSRCVKPPIIFGDVARRGPMTVEWARYAQSLTARPMKGMLTGPVTILQWSFVRDDQPRRETCWQIALAIRDEVADLEEAGIAVIQIDEPALREGLPLRRDDWAEYLRWTVDAFRLASAGVRDETQIHTHMCYCEFNDIIDSIAALDADVISIETSRSQMELLGAFAEFRYPNEIGPGVYDIHSPQIPTREGVELLLGKALAVLSPEQLWVNPDCGLKTRKWEEVKPALATLVEAARALRGRLAESPARDRGPA